MAPQEIVITQFAALVNREWKDSSLKKREMLRKYTIDVLNSLYDARECKMWNSNSERVTAETVFDLLCMGEWKKASEYEKTVFENAVDLVHSCMPNEIPYARMAKVINLVIVLQ
jgi:hypothetical protein